MRAIGKRSLSSLLAMGLHITRIILVIILAGLTIAMVVLPFAAVIGLALEQVENVSLSGELTVSRTRYLDIAFHFVTVLVMLFVVTRLLEILKTLRFGSPFVTENALRFRALGYALMLGEGAKIAFSLLSLIFGADLEIDIELIAWLAIMAVFVLSEVFREGARMKEEQDLTV